MSRSIWKITYIHKSFFKLVDINVSKIYLTSARSSRISPKLQGSCFGIYNGLSFKFFRMRPDMFNFKFGEFAPGRRMTSGINMHSKKWIKKR